MTPALSVLLPCFNAAATLGEAIKSLQSQTYDDFEVVAVDDGSSDGTPELLEAVVASDPRFRLLRQPHRGIAASLLHAAAEARAPLLARMDADDRMHQKRFERQVAYLDEHPEVSVLGSRVQLFPRETLQDGYRRYESWLNGLLAHEEMRRDLFVESPLAHPSVVMRRDALESVGGYRDDGLPEDYDLWMRFAWAGHRFAKLPDVLLEWRDAPTRASRNQPAFAIDRFLDVKERYLMKHVLVDARPVTVWGAGPIGKEWARRLDERETSVHTFIDVDPRKIGQRIYGVSVLPPDDLDDLADHFILVAVGSPGWPPPRDEIRERLDAAGFTELEDYLCLA